ncbi:MAG: hypothetical protein Q4E51_05285 [Lachnospiraceae bacterium]|nr:hypothetical protein [Lachnospiraceae bacterium]
MKIKCEYCGSMIPDTVDECPNCGASNTHVVRVANGTPKTIAELQKWYMDRGLPPYETTRFFIGIDYKKPRAFGIYKDEDGNFVVYKNKDNGERAVRYKGNDEAYAVNELFMRLKQEIIQQKNLKNSKGQSISSKNNEADNIFNNLKKLAVFGTVSVVGFFAVLVIIGFLVMLFDHSPSKGYYNYGGTTYYNISGDSDTGWYYYDSYDDWAPIDASSVPADIKETPSANDFFYTPDWDSETQLTDFESTDMYEEYQESHSYSNSDDSSDYDWGSSDSWDSDSSDWGSDW